MSISVDRRAAFTRAFKAYPHAIEEFVTKHVTIRNPFDQNSMDRPLSDDAQRRSVMEIVMAQFFTRLIQTRCTWAGEAMEKFGNETVERYKNFKLRRIGGLEIFAGEKYRRALQAFEQEMVNIIFGALAEEVDLYVGAEIEGRNPEIDKWDEIDFWTDVFLSFGANSRPSWPRWTLVAQDIFLSNRAEFSAALDASPIGKEENDNAETTH